MKLRTSLAILVCIGSAACGAETPNAPPAPPPPPPAASAAEAPAPAPPPAAPKPSMADLQKATVGAMVAAFNAHDAKKVGDAYAADAVMAMPSAEGMKAKTGRDAIVESYAGLFQHVPDCAFTVSRVYQVGDTAVVEWVGSGSDAGKKTGFHGAMALSFDQDGLIKTEHSYYDESTIAMQLGHAPGKARPVAEAPSGAPEYVVATGSDDEKKAVDALKASWPAIWPKKDAKAYEANLADDALHVDYAFPNDYAGKKANLGELAMMAKAVPDMQVELVSTWAAPGNVAIAEWVFSGTQKGAIGPIKATGKKFSVHGLDIDTFDKDGKIVKAYSYDNSVELLAQLGLLPPPAKGAPAAAPKGKDEGAKPGPAAKSEAKPETMAAKAEPAKPAAAAPAAPAKK
jgi:steroid delta-isomerase-like uncharacterized protein